jgi:hypothetical protein
MRLLVLASVAVVALALPAAMAAGPGGPPTFHDHDTFTDVDPNFCDTGQSVDLAGRFNAKVWIGETGGDPDQDLFVAFNYDITITNPVNGAAVVDSAAGLVTNEIVEGLESGPHTHVFVENGLRAKLKLANGGVLTLDAGSLGYSISFDAADNVTDFQLLFVHGPHPAFDSPVWCDAAIDALGL